MDSSAALGPCIAQIDREPATGTRPRFLEEKHALRACFDELVRRGNHTCVAPLRKIATRRMGAESWRAIGRPDERNETSFRPTLSGWWDPGVLAVAALAACGDREAEDVLVDALVEGSRATAHERMEQDAMRRSSHNGYPGGFWAGLALLTSPREVRHWPAFRWIHDLLSADEEVRDRVLRRAARHDDVPNMGKILLTGFVRHPTDEDVDLLMRIWNEAITAPVRTLEVLDIAARREPHMKPWMSETIRYNADACAVAFALLRMRRSDRLLELARTAPPDDPVLHGEIVYAMTKTQDPRFAACVVEYVRRAWDPWTRPIEFSAQFAPGVEFRTSSLPASLTRHAPDRGYRRRAIMRYLFSRPIGGTTEVRDLLMDRSLNPGLRVLLFRGPKYFAADGEDLLPAVRVELEEILVGPLDPIVRDAAEDCEEYLDRVAERLATPNEERRRRLRSTTK